MNSDISAQRQDFTADQYVHIDHAPLEVLLGTPGDGDNLARPWLSLAIDAESRAIVGAFLSSEPPSCRSCTTVLRDIVRRNCQSQTR